MPAYRVEFFESLKADLERQGIQVDIITGAPPPEWKERGDSVVTDAVRITRTYSPSIRGRALLLKVLPREVLTSGRYDLIVVEHAVRNLETYCLLALPWTRRKVAWWGHGRTYTKPESNYVTVAKRWLARQGVWFFAYTSGGARAVAAAGVAPDRITVVNNTIDVRSLEQAISSTSPSDLSRLAAQHDLRGKTGLFVGGLDADKRLPFLLEAARLIHAEEPDFRLLVAGDGSQRRIVHEAAESLPFIRYVGRATGLDKALLLASAQVLMMPGRVGLIAVDSFASRLPIVTTNWPWHAPEFEYLDESNSVVLDDSVTAYAGGCVRLLNDPERLLDLGNGCARSSVLYSTEAMVRRFSEGIQNAIMLVRPHG
ncbi:glycosyltransferase family 4 protein [Geodermatophilus ruber]|nr:glycosyltransferase family 4 protein [Geodermatophilus ruber]